MKRITKSMMTGVFVSAMVLSIGATSAFAASTKNKQSFMDTDGNGVCNYAINSSRYVDKNGDGVCDNYGTGWNGGKCRKGGSGRNFIDVDRDGNCDNYTSGQGLRLGREARVGCNR